MYKYAEMALNTQIYKYTTTQIFNYAYKAKDEKSIHSGPSVATQSIYIYMQSIKYKGTKEDVNQSEKQIFSINHVFIINHSFF